MAVDRAKGQTISPPQAIFMVLHISTRDAVFSVHRIHRCKPILKQIETRTLSEILHWRKKSCLCDFCGSWSNLLASKTREGCVSQPPLSCFPQESVGGKRPSVKADGEQKEARDQAGWSWLPSRPRLRPDLHRRLCLARLPNLQFRDL